MGLFLPGIPQLALLGTANNTASKVKTLFLPVPSAGVPEVEWEEKADLTDLIDGSESNRRLGFIPTITFKWALYVDQVSAVLTEGVSMGAWGITIGPNNGQMPSIADLLVLLSAAPGCLEINPGPADPTVRTLTAGGIGVGNSAQAAYQLQQAQNLTYVNTYGTWPVYTTPRTNLCTNNQTIGGTGWTNVACTLVSGTNTAPDGTPTASLLAGSASTGYTYSGSATVALATNYTVSAFIKQGTATVSELALYNSGPSVDIGSIQISWAAGVPWASGVTNATNIQFQSVGNGWYRVSMVVNTATYSIVRALFYPDATNASLNIYCWGVQVEAGSIVTDYMGATTSAAVTVTPSYYPAIGSPFAPILNPVAGTVQIFRQDWQGNQLMYPTSRINYLLQSGAFNVTTGGAWQPPTNATLTSGISDPAGGTAAFTLTATAANGYVFQSCTIPASGTYCNGIWIRRRTGTGTVSMEDPSGTAHAVTITSAWTRFQFPGTSYSATLAYFAVLLGTSGDAVDIAFGQCEPGSVSTAYNPTTTAAVTAPADYTLGIQGSFTFSTAPLAAYGAFPAAVITATCNYQDYLKGFVAQSWKTKKIGTNKLGMATGLEVTFRGGTSQAAMVLGAF